MKNIKQICAHEPSPPFTGPTPGPTKFGKEATPLELFAEMTNYFLTKWQAFTNERGRKRNTEKWVDLTKEEVAAFISILFHMSIKQLPDVSPRAMHVHTHG